MKFYTRLGLGLALAAATLGLASCEGAYAAATSRTSLDPVASNSYLEGWSIPDLGTPYSNSTTSYTDVGASVAVPDWATKFGDYSGSFIACYSVQASKATSTTGSVGVYINGALDTDTVRTGTFGQAEVLDGCFGVARGSSGAAQTIKLQAKSGDSAAFTITSASLIVWYVKSTPAVPS